MTDYADYIERLDALKELALLDTGEEEYTDNISRIRATIAISNIPAADVAPVRHGTWLPQKGGGLCCSECGHYALDESDGNFIHVSVPSEFCPHCGAKMDAQGEE